MFNGDRGASYCHPCSSVNNYPGGTQQLASTAQSQCVAEGPGTYTSTTTCTGQCGTGTFSSQQSATTCTPCGSNQVAPAGATASAQCTTCGTGTAPNTGQSSCTPTSTGTHHRKRELEAPKGYCPEGFTACPVDGRRRLWQCIDTQTSIDSCGGCPGVGVDCTQFDDMATASCNKGQCSYACPPHMELASIGCVATVGNETKIARGASRRRHLAHASGMLQRPRTSF